MSPPPDSAKTAVVLVQLGTPDAPTPGALRRYLREFLGDPRVVDLPRWLWLPLLYGPVLAFRPRTSARLYRRIWTDQGSPLLITTRRLAAKLQAALGEEFVVRLGMRYGQPTLQSSLEATTGMRRLVVPLFPQFSRTTTASVGDRVAELCERHGLGGWEWIDDYHDHAGYVEAVAQRAREMVARHGPPDRWVVSYHGIPQRYADRGDPYPSRCEGTTRALAEVLGWREGDWVHCYQSRVGPAAWLQPYTDEVLAELGREGLKSVFAICPGFAADCLETLDEIAQVGQEQFAATGGGTLHYVPCVNDSDTWVEALSDIVTSALGTEDGKSLRDVTPA